jgi:hypothetical protein
MHGQRPDRQLVTDSSLWGRDRCRLDQYHRRTWSVPKKLVSPWIPARPGTSQSAGFRPLEGACAAAPMSAAFGENCTSPMNSVVKTCLRVGGGICRLLVLARSGSETLPLLKLLFWGHVAVQRMCSAATLGEKPVSRTGLSPRVVLLAGLREHSRETERGSRACARQTRLPGKSPKEIDREVADLALERLRAGRFGSCQRPVT